jgi:hypothetical protein
MPTNIRPSPASLNAALLLLTLLAGCAPQSLRPGAEDPAQVTRSINLSGFPPEYKRGFGAGCADAKSASGRAPQRPKAEPAYVRGWVDGVHYCSPRAPR